MEKTLDLLASYLHAKPSLVLVSSSREEPINSNRSQTKFPAKPAAILDSLMVDAAGSIAGAYLYPDYQDRAEKRLRMSLIRAGKQGNI